MIAIERYELTQAIAACSLKINFLNNLCVINDPDSPPSMKNLAVRNYFTAGACVVAVDTGYDETTGICYHTSANAAFNS